MCTWTSPCPYLSPSHTIGQRSKQAAVLPCCDLGIVAKYIICGIWWSITGTCNHVKPKLHIFLGFLHVLCPPRISPLCFHIHGNTAQVGQPEGSGRWLVSDAFLHGLSWWGVWCAPWQIFSTAHTGYIDLVTQWSVFSFKNQHQVPSICIISLLTTKKASGKALQQSLDNGWEA